MKLLIFRTDKKVKAIKSLFRDHPVILDWSIDTEDIDNVLRIEATESLHEGDVISLVKTYGFHCEVLPD